MKALKYLLYAAGGLVAVIVAIVAAFAMLFDPNEFKGQIERVTKEQLQRTLKLEGDVKLAYFPKLGVSLGKMTLSERNSASEFASLESAHVSVAVMPLLSGRAVVDEVRIAGFKAGIVKGRDGKTNLEDLFAGADAASSPQSGGSQPSVGPGDIGFNVSGIRLERASLNYRDEKSGEEISLTGLELKTGRIADGVPGKFELSAAAKRNKPALDLKLKVSGSYRFDLAAGSISLSGLQTNLSGAVAGITGLDLKLKGDLTAVPKKGEATAENLALEASGASGKERIEMRLSIPRLAVAGEGARAAEMGGELQLKAEGRSMNASLKLSGVAASAIAASVDALSVDIQIESPALAEKKLSVPIRGSLRADLEKSTATAVLSARFDESNIQAKLGVTRFAPLATIFDVNIDRLNVDKYFPPETAASGALGSADPKPGTPSGDSPVDLSALKDLQTSGRISIGALTVKSVKLSAVKAEIRAANGKLDISPHSANLYQGTLNGSLSANSSDNQITAKQNLNAVSIGPLVRDLAGKDAIEGRGNIAIDLTASGTTVDAMKKALAGSARLQLKDGAIKGINLAETLRKAKAALGSKSAQQQAATGAAKTDFSELSASFAISKGVAHNEDLQAKAPLFRLTGSGDIDIGNSNLNYVAMASVVATAQGQGGEELSHVRGLTIPVKLTGSFDAPSYEIDYAAVVKGAVTERIKQKVEDKIKESLGGALKGLFGR